ncbi:MAG: VanZ family protein [Eubacteriales bacterium]
MCKRKSRMYVRWIPAIIIMMIIFYFSHAPATVSSQTSEAVTSSVLDYFQRWFGVSPFTNALAVGMESVIRKLAHVIEYAMLAMTFYYAYYSEGRSRKRMIGVTFICSVAYAISDEVHQLFIPGRAGQVIDVLIDTCGVVLGIVFAMVLRKGYEWYGKKREENCC